MVDFLQPMLTHTKDLMIWDSIIIKTIPMTIRKANKSENLLILILKPHFHLMDAILRVQEVQDGKGVVGDQL